MKTPVATSGYNNYTDHQALQYLTDLTSDKPIRSRVARWLDFLSLFQCLKIVYKPGATNVVADAMSRHPLYEREQLHPSIPNTAWATQATSARKTATTAEIPTGEIAINWAFLNALRAGRKAKTNASTRHSKGNS